MIVTGHQLNFLPGLSVMQKIAAADACVWMDEMQYERHAWVNRNRLADGTWLTVPVAEHDTFAPINRVKIADPTFRFRRKIARSLEHRLGAATAAPYVTELARPYQRLAGLNAALMRHLTAALRIEVEQHYQSHLGAGRYEVTSEGLAGMVAELGGSVWLSGPSGRNYLDERPFSDLGIEVRYWRHQGANPCALELLRERVAA